MKRALLCAALVSGCGGRNHHMTVPAALTVGAIIAGAFILAARYDTTPNDCMPPSAGCVDPDPPTGLPTDDL
jgi:hypothetical protein